MIDKSGQPRSNEELIRAINVVDRTLVTGAMSCPPQLFLELSVIRDALRECLSKRREEFSQRIPK